MLDHLKGIPQVAHITYPNREIPFQLLDLRGFIFFFIGDNEIGLKTATREFAAQREAQGNTKEIRTAYLIWQEPYMSVGNDTFIHDMMQRCGLENIFAHRTRYPQATIADLRDMETELVLLSSEPFPFKQKHVEELQSQLPESRVMLADGEMFSWYGSRLRLSPQYFEDLQRQVLSLTHAS